MHFMLVRVSILWMILGMSVLDHVFAKNSVEIANTTQSDIEKKLRQGNFSISQNGWTIDPEYVDEKLLQLGDGISMELWDQPKRRVDKDPLGVRTQKGPQSFGSTQPYKVTDSFLFREATSVEEVAAVLSAYFKASYGFASGSAALKMAQQDSKTSQSIFALLESVGETRTLDKHVPQVSWNSQVKPWKEGENVDPGEYRRQFLLDFGSHYVTSISYGYRLAIRGKISTSDTKSQTDIKAAFKAAFVSGSAEGGISDDTKKTLSSSELELVFSATSGGLTDKEGNPKSVTLVSLEEILALLKSINSGEIQAHLTPVSATVNTYWNLVAEYPYARALLGQTGNFTPPDQRFGVPEGTIIPWYPSSRFIEKHGDHEQLIPPDGWAICDGTLETPDLRDRFIRGAQDFSKMGSGGEDQHTHPGKSSASKDTPRYRNGGTKAYQRQEQEAKEHPGLYGQDVVHHTHPFTTGKAFNVPAYYGLVYIMKLAS
jgi:hypothetical protein